MMKMTVNGTEHVLDPEPRELLIHTLREQFKQTGPHVGCDTGTCGACTVVMDGKLIKSCTVFTVQCDGSSVTTIEGTYDSEVHENVRQALQKHGGVQCGYCTPGMVMTGAYLIHHDKVVDRDKVNAGLKGNLCMCTGYAQIVDAVVSVAEQVNGDAK